MADDAGYILVKGDKGLGNRILCLLSATLLLESVLLAGAGCAIGALFGLFGQLLGSHAILDVTGFPVVFSFGFVLALKSLAIVTTVAVAIAAVPGYFVARVRPAVGLFS